MAWYSSREGTPITLVAVHTNEGPNTPGDEGSDLSAENLCRWMDTTPRESGVSYHRVIDDDSVVNYVADQYKAWSLRSGNPRSLNVCLTGYASQSRAQWMQHDNQLRMTADVIRAWCDIHGIPKVKLTAQQVGSDQSGICGHWDWTVGKQDGTHTDPGSNFPWDVLMSYVAPPAPDPSPTTPPSTPASYAGPYRNGSKDAGAPGMTYGAVWRIQDRLKRAYASYAGHLVTDGWFGDQTEAAVAEFQRRYGGLVVDGVVGRATWSALKL